MTNNIWITSDTHFGHKNIVRGISTWKSGFRDFNSQEEHDETIINNINDLVKEDDVLYHLGDFAFGVKAENVPKYRSKIRCKNIIILTGNHDDFSLNRRYFTFATDYYEIKLFGKYIVMFHYPIWSWNGQGKGSIHLHGHQHKNGNINNGRIKDLDIGGNNFKPYNLEDLVKEMSKIEVWCPDHHVEVR